MINIFICYRREDSGSISDRINDHLARKFGQAKIFKDVDSITPGKDFREEIEKAVGSCNVLLAVIGRDWLALTTKAGGRRIDDPKDFVRLEIETALERQIPVIPVLAEDAEIPGEMDLPESIRPLVYRNGLRIRHDPDFARDVERLIKSLIKLLPTEKIAEQLHSAGIVEYLEDYHKWKGWLAAFKTARTLDIFAAYPLAFIRTYRKQLQQFVAKGKRIRVILADPDAKATVAALARRFGHKRNDVKSQIKDCVNEFILISNNSGLVQVKKATGDHPVKLVLFSNKCLLVTYSLRPRTEAPSLVGIKGRQLYDYVHEEFEAAWNSALPMNLPATPASPSTTPAGE
jgi:TIR domain